MSDSYDENGQSSSSDQYFGNGLILHVAFHYVCLKQAIHSPKFDLKNEKQDLRKSQNYDQDEGNGLKGYDDLREDAHALQKYDHVRQEDHDDLQKCGHGQGYGHGQHSCVSGSDLLNERDSLFASFPIV